MSPLIDLADVSVTYPGAVPVHALKRSSLRINDGERVAVVGPSGSGKTTLLQVLGLLARPTTGTYHLVGHDVSAMDESQRCDVRGSMIGFVFQAFHLMAHRTVGSNVELPLRYSPQSFNDTERAERVSDALSQVGLEHRAHHLCNQLSGGESQRVAIARAMVTRPRLILADEPTGNLDEASAAGIHDLMDEMNARTGLTIVLVTHSSRLAQRMPRRLNMAEGVLHPLEA